MPFIHIKVAGKALSADQQTRIQNEITSLMANILRKKAQLTAVFVEQVTSSGWSIGAKPVNIAAHMEVSITAGTNTVEEKALFIAQANQLLTQILGNELPEATYIVIHELPSDSWGYSGQTQKARARPIHSALENSQAISVK